MGNRLMQDYTHHVTYDNFRCPQKYGGIMVTRCGTHLGAVTPRKRKVTCPFCQLADARPRYIVQIRWVLTATTWHEFTIPTNLSRAIEIYNCERTRRRIVTASRRKIVIPPGGAYS